MLSKGQLTKSTIVCATFHGAKWRPKSVSETFGENVAKWERREPPTLGRETEPHLWTWWEKECPATSFLL